MKAIFVYILILISVGTYAFESPWWWRKQKEPQIDSIQANINGQAHVFKFDFIAGKSHNNPSFAIWIEDMYGNFIHELFVTQSIATGIFRYGDSSSGQWEAGERRYFAALPYYFHKRSANPDKPNIPGPNNPVIDAYTGATPQKDFHLVSRSNSKELVTFRVIIEINQTWDFNNYWHNAKFPDDADYRTSAQPSLVYAVTIDVNNLMDNYYFNPIGHGHYSGKDGKLYTDLSGFTTALEIFERIGLKIKPEVK